MGIFFVGENPEDPPTGSTIVSELCPSSVPEDMKKVPSSGTLSFTLVAEAGF
jgi:hypothetical protein